MARSLLACLLAVALLVGCGDEDDPAASSEPTPAPVNATPAIPGSARNASPAVDSDSRSAAAASRSMTSTLSW